MISPGAVYWASGAVYAVATLALLAWLRRIPDQYNKYCYPVLLVVVVSGLSVVLDAASVGVLVVNGTEVAVPSLLGDLVAYPVLWGIAALLAGVSRKLFAIAVVLPFAQRLSFTVASISGGVVALLSLGILVGGHIYLIYLYRNQIWDAARSVPVEQRLLHWKARNLLLFLIGMIIVFAVLYLFGLFDQVVAAVLTQYMNFLIRAGFAGFLFANVTSIEASGDLLEDLGGDTGGSGPPDLAGAD